MINKPLKPSIRTLRSLVALLFITSPTLAQECGTYQISHLSPFELIAGPSYGSSVSISGDTAIVGYRGDGHLMPFTGSVYIFKNIDGEWVENNKILAPDGAQGDNFGSSVSIDNDTIAIGAFTDDDNGQNTGSVYLYVRDNQRTDFWFLQTKLILKDPIDSAHFGTTVALDNDTLIVKSAGEANASAFVHVFTRTNGSWTQQTTLQLADDSTDKFANSISIHANTIAIKAKPKVFQSPDSSSIYVYTRNKGVWTLQDRIEPTDFANTSPNYNGVSLYADTIVMGSSNDNDNGLQTGAAYIFTRSQNEWTQHSKIYPNEDEFDNFSGFGSSVFIEGDTIAIGSQMFNNQQQNDGAIYIFKRRESTWEQQQKIARTQGQYTLGFGQTVDISGDQIIAGASGFNWEELRNSDTAYIFDICSPICPADIIPDGSLNFFDISAFLTAFTSEDPIADFTNDGNYNYFDVSTFLIAFAAGCP